MADYLKTEVYGYKQLAKNLADFGDEKVVGRVVRAALQSGGRLVRPRAASNARSFGLSRQAVVKRDRKEGGTYMTFGRIPKSIKVGRAYIPRAERNTYRVKVMARSQRGRGIYRNKAPHAHLIEHGWQPKGGHRVAGRAFLGPALSQTAPEVLAKIADTMRKKIDEWRPPTK